MHAQYMVALEADTVLKCVLEYLMEVCVCVCVFIQPYNQKIARDDELVCVSLIICFLLQPTNGLLEEIALKVLECM